MRIHKHYCIVLGFLMQSYYIPLFLYYVFQINDFGKRRYVYSK